MWRETHCKTHGIKLFVATSLRYALVSWPVKSSWQSVKIVDDSCSKHVLDLVLDIVNMRHSFCFQGTFHMSRGCWMQMMAFQEGNINWTMSKMEKRQRETVSEWRERRRERERDREAGRGRVSDSQIQILKFKHQSPGSSDYLQGSVNLLSQWDRTYVARSEEWWKHYLVHIVTCLRFQPIGMDKHNSSPFQMAQFS